MEHNKVIVVDETDSVIGAEYMFDAIAKGLIRRCSRIFIFNEKGEVLIQKRSAMITKPLLLDQSAAGHVDEGESYEECAYRELKEELGIEGVPLTTIATSVRSTGFMNGLFKGTIPNTYTVLFNTDEVESVYWYDVVQLDRELEEFPERFSPSLHEIWPQYKEKLLSNVTQE